MDRYRTEAHLLGSDIAIRVKLWKDDKFNGVKNPFYRHQYIFDLFRIDCMQSRHQCEALGPHRTLEPLISPGQQI